jgi:hypothetical protein
LKKIAIVAEKRERVFFFFFEVLHGENERWELRRKTHLREKKLRVGSQ